MPSPVSGERQSLLIQRSMRMTSLPPSIWMRAGHPSKENRINEQKFGFAFE
jgi:hypothetical protein